MSTVGTPRPKEAARPELCEGRSRSLRLSSYLAATLASAIPAAGLAMWTAGRYGNRLPSSLSYAGEQFQILGWCGSLALVLGFYAVAVSGDTEVPVAYSRVVFLLWAVGSGLYLIGVVAAVPRVVTMANMLQFVAVLLFAACASRQCVWRAWGEAAVTGLWPSFALSSLGLLCFLVLSFSNAVRNHVPDVGFERKLLLIGIWGFAAPGAWATCSLLLPRLMRLKPVKTRLLLVACVLDAAGVMAAVAGKLHVAAVLLLHAAIFVPSAVRAFGKSQGTGSLKNTAFVRLAYVWLRVAAMLGVWASVHDRAGIWSGSQHALMVGFISTVVMVLGEPLVSALLGSRISFHNRLSVTCLVLLNAGCFLSVSCEILAFQGYIPWLRHVLPLAALAELAAFVLFAGQIAMIYAANRNQAGTHMRPCQEPSAIEG